MPPDRTRHATSLQNLDWIVTDDGSLTLWDQNLQETYHSGCGAVAESLIVYLSNSGVLSRLQQGLATSVFEMGLGTCTTFLLTAAFAESHGAPLDYWAIDNRVLPAEFIRQLDILSHIEKVLQQNAPLLATAGSVTGPDFDQMEPLVASLIANWPSRQELDLLHQRHLQAARQSTKQSMIVMPNSFDIQLSPTTRLRLLVGDASRVDWQQLVSEREKLFDSVFFDAFSPDSTPELWTEFILEGMFHGLEMGGTLTSYCVKSGIRKMLERVGFSVKRLSGPVGGKREVLLAIRDL